MKEPDDPYRRQDGEFRPPVEWLSAFRDQLTLPLLQRLTSYARMCGHKVAAAGGTRDVDAYAEDLVSETVRKVRDGIIAWQHDRIPLEVILFHTIKSRSRHDRSRAKKYTHDAIGHGTPRSRRAEADASISATDPRSRRELSVFCAQVVAHLRAGAGSDQGIQRLLDGYAIHGARCKADVCHYTGMAETEYHKARLRLNRLIENLGLSPFATKSAA